MSTARSAAGSSPGSPGALLGGRYRLEDLLDEVHEARTWRAVDTVLHRDVRVHTLPADDARVEDMLAAARLSATVTDAHLLRVLDADLRDDVAWVISEWGEGQTLDQMVSRGVLPPDRSAWLVREAASAIAVAHRADQAHGRLAPENVMVTSSGTVRLIGFGIDGVLQQSRRRSGNYPDASDQEADLRDLAGLLYAALVGRWPGASGSTVKAAPRDARGPLRPRRVRAGVPRPLDAICDRLLSGSVSTRSAHQLAALLTEYIGELAAADPDLLPTPEPEVPDLARGEADKSDKAGEAPSPDEPDQPVDDAADEPADEAAQAVDDLTEVDVPFAESPVEPEADVADDETQQVSALPAGPIPGQRTGAEDSGAPSDQAHGDERLARLRGQRGDREDRPADDETDREADHRQDDGPEAREEPGSEDTVVAEPAAETVVEPAPTGPPPPPAPELAPAPTNLTGSPPPDPPVDRPLFAPDEPRPARRGAVKASATDGWGRRDWAEEHPDPEWEDAERRRAEPAWPMGEDPEDDGGGSWDGEEPRRGQRLPLLIGLIVLVALVVVLVSFVLAYQGGRGQAPSAGASPTASSSVGAADGRVLRIAAVRDFDPFGNPPSENPETVGNVDDGNQRTTWQTTRYRGGADLGGLKPGVGVLIDLGTVRRVGSVAVDLVGRGTSLTVLAAPTGSPEPTGIEGLTRLATENGAGEQAVLNSEPPTRARYVVVWLTRLPAVAGGFRGEISEITVRS